MARIWPTTRWAVGAGGSPATAALICQVASPERRGAVTRRTPGAAAMRCGERGHGGAVGGGRANATVTGDWPAPAKSRVSASATVRELWPCGMTALSLAERPHRRSAGSAASHHRPRRSAPRSPGPAHDRRAKRYQRSPSAACRRRGGRAWRPTAQQRRGHGDGDERGDDRDGRAGDPHRLQEALREQRQRRPARRPPWRRRTARCARRGVIVTAMASRHVGAPRPAPGGSG